MDAAGVANVLKGLEILTSWSVVTAVIGCVALWKLKNPIGRFIDRLNKAKGPGFELEAAALPAQAKAKPLPPPTVIAGATVPQTTPTAIDAQQLQIIAAAALVEPDNAEAQLRFQHAVAQHPQVGAELLMNALRAYGFEKCFANIFGTQVKLLVQLAGLPIGTFESMEEAATYHARHVTIAKSLTNAFTERHRYFDFLTSYKLIEIAGDTVAITRLGRYFISYIQGNYPQSWDQRLA